MKTAFSRKELYDLVWSKPITKIAAEYGYSDNGIRKICKKHNIPMPKVGYWQKVEYKKQVKRIALPAGNSTTEIVLSAADNPIHENVGNFKPKDRLLESVRLVLGDLQSQELPDHPLVVLAKKSYEINKKERYYRNSEMKGVHAGAISFYASEELIPRVFSFYNTLLHLLEKRGHSVIGVDDKSRLNIKGVTMDMRCRERQKRVKNGGVYSSDLVRTGLLTFEAGISYHHKTWNDGRLLIENRINEIVAFLELEAFKSMRDDYKSRRDERLRKIQEAKEWRRHEEEEWEIEKGKMLLADTLRMRKFKSLRHLLRQAKNEMTNPTEEQLHWLKWANERLDELNPFGHGLEAFVNRYLGPAPTLEKKSMYDDWGNWSGKREKKTDYWPGKVWYS